MDTVLAGIFAVPFDLTVEIRDRERRGEVHAAVAFDPCDDVVGRGVHDFLVVGTGAGGGGTLARRLAEAGFSVIGLDAGPWFRPLEDFASDEAEQTGTVLDRRQDPHGREPGAAWFQQQRQRGWGQYRAFLDGVTALPSGVVQVAQPVGLWRGLAGRYRAHELNAAALALAEGCEALGIAWTETPLATLSAPHTRASIAASAT